MIENYCWTCGKFTMIFRESCMCADCYYQPLIVNRIWTYGDYDVDGTPLIKTRNDYALAA